MTVNPDEVVALGAAVQAAVIKGEVKDVLLLDVIPLSLGVETQGGVMHKIIERNTTIPARRTEVFSTAEENQSAVDIVVLQGERERAADNRVLGRFRLEGIRPAPRGVPQIEVTFDIDANGILSVSARDKDTGSEQRITISESSNLDQTEVERMIAEAERHRDEDARVRELVDARNALDTAAYQVERRLAELGDTIPENQQARAELLVADAREALRGEAPLDRIRMLTGELQQIYQGLAAGTYNSPQLLQLSGIGPAALLGALGIPVRHALAGVGENLRDHYAPRFVARVKNIDTINERVRGVRLASEIARWVFTRKGVLALSPTHVYCFWRSEPTVANSDLQLTFTPASYREGVQGELEREPGMTVASWQQRPESRGYVRLKSSDPFEAPIIQPNYLALESDRRVLLAGMRLARRLLETKPLEPYYDHEDFPGPGVQSDDELLGAAKQRGTTTFHPSGTCRMGPASDPTAVVDDQLRVHGLDGLRVIDASIMPTMLSANLNAATMMIAEKASDLLLGRTAPEPVVVAAAS